MEVGNNILRLSRLEYHGPETKRGLPPQSYLLYNFGADNIEARMVFGLGIGELIIGREASPELDLDKSAAPRHFILDQPTYSDTIGVKDYANEIGVNIHMANDPWNLELVSR